MADGSSAGEVDPLMDLEWPVDRSKYELLHQIGEGSSANVFKSLCKLNPPQEVAIKIIDLDKARADIDEIQKEMMVMRSSRHENLVSYYTSFTFKRELWVVMRLLDCGSLLDILRYRNKMKKGGVMDEGVIATVLKCVLQGLSYLHSHGQIHRDVKAGNILLASDGSVQLADFGVSTWLADDRFRALEEAFKKTSEKKKKKKAQAMPPGCTTFVGTPCWMAPEVMEQVKPYDERADIWSLGITALEIATGTAPYAKYDPMKVLIMTIEGAPPTLDTCAEEHGHDYSHYKKPFRKFVEMCLQKDSTKRPTAEELLKSEFIKKMAKDKAYVARNLCAGLPSLAILKKPATSLVPGRVKSSVGKSGRFVVSSGWDFGDGSMRRSIHFDDVDDPKGSPSVAPIVEGTATPAEGAGGDSGPAADAAPQGADGQQPGAMVVNLCLRMRGMNENQIQVISFEMHLPDESALSLSEEMVAGGLLAARDVHQVSEAIDQMLADPQKQAIIFPLYDAKGQGLEAPSQETVPTDLPMGFAHLARVVPGQVLGPAEGQPAAPETAAAPVAAAPVAAAPVAAAPVAAAPVAAAPVAAAPVAAAPAPAAPAPAAPAPAAPVPAAPEAAPAPAPAATAAEVAPPVPLTDAPPAAAPVAAPEAAVAAPSSEAGADVAPPVQQADV